MVIEPSRERQMMRMIVRHLSACAEEGKRDFRDIADTPAGAGLAAIYGMLRATAWSLGSSLASNGVSAEPMRSDMMRELLQQFDEGYSKPGEGVMF